MDPFSMSPAFLSMLFQQPGGGMPTGRLPPLAQGAMAGSSFPGLGMYHPANGGVPWMNPDTNQLMTGAMPGGNSGQMPWDKPSFGNNMLNGTLSALLTGLSYL